MTQQANAWILELAGQFYAAIGEQEMVHLIDEPELFTVPEGLPWCDQVISWQGEELPVMNLQTLLMPASDTARPDIPVVGIITYQRADAAPQYGGLLLNRIPVKKPVSDEQACDLPEPQQQWQQLAIACFSDNGRAMPILDLPRLFAEVTAGNV